MRTEDTIWCDGCGVEILWTPVIAKRRDFCCEGCRDGIPCECGEREELDEYQRTQGQGAATETSGTPQHA